MSSIATCLVSACATWRWWRSCIGWRSVHKYFQRHARCRHFAAGPCQIFVRCEHSTHTETIMTEIEFNALAADGYNRIPLIAETYADLDTPLSIYLKLAHAAPEGGRNSCLLESVVDGERFGRYSFIGLPAKT